jgi:hypothetical protein
VAGKAAEADMAVKGSRKNAVNTNKATNPGRPVAVANCNLGKVVKKRMR